MLKWLFSPPLTVGTPAPDFTLPDNMGETVSLSALRGKYVVLIFYPCDNSPTCIKQMCEFRDRWGFMTELGAEVFGVNPMSQKSHESFRDDYDLPFRLLVDKSQKAALDYKAKGWIVRRTVYLIGPDGKIAFSRRGRPSPIEMLECIPGALDQSADALSAHPA
ncbi:MAG: peroxiredoxin [Alphaproteobacteria bacterium]|nr:MAG: peroxiredoxin [Alphaproteobacteria bacterium]